MLWCTTNNVQTSQFLVIFFKMVDLLQILVYIWNHPFVLFLKIYTFDILLELWWRFSHLKQHMHSILSYHHRTLKNDKDQTLKFTYIKQWSILSCYSIVFFWWLDVTSILYEIKCPFLIHLVVYIRISVSINVLHPEAKNCTNSFS